MKVFENTDGFLLRLARGEEIHATLTRFAADRGIRGAWVSGLGAVRDVELGFYHLETRSYDRQVIDEEMEILSLTGNLSLLDGRPFLHAHVSLMRADFSVAGGHLFRGTVAATGEFSLHQTDLRLERRMDEEIGLPLLEAERGA